MDNDLTNEKLVAYIYGELSDEEAKTVKKLLLENPEARKKHQELLSIKNELGKVQDVEVEPPMILFSDTTSRPMWSVPFHNPLLQKVMAVAAILLFVLIAGKLAGLQVSRQQNGITIGFDTSKDEEVDKSTSRQTLTSQQPVIVDSTKWQNYATMQANLMKENASLLAQMEILRGEINAIQHAVEGSSLVTSKHNLKDEKLENLIKEVTDKNYKFFTGAIETANLRQEDYIKTLFADFALYLEEQRTQDLRIIENTLINLKQESDIKNLETEEVIAKLIKSVNDKNY